MASDGDAVSETKLPYDVFLSFRGEDTRHTFTCHLFAALCRKGINTFMDDEKLKRGDQLGPVLLKAIHESKISVVVFSKDYADSSWCLDELVEIHDSMNSTNQLVWPIFYKVDPSDVRHQKGSYGQAMTEHESRFGKNSEKVKKWRSALTDIANLKGDPLKVEQGRDESKLIDDLAREIFIKLSPKDLSNNEHIVGREYQVEILKSLLDLKSRHISCSLGIHGTGGIGKTTLAKALYDSIYKQFEASTFLLNVRETSEQIEGLKHLQERLLSEILEDRKIKLNNKEEGIRTIKRRLGVKRVLIVLDDVDDIEQLQNLTGEGCLFGLGSKVIITTRNTQLLDQGGVQKRYEVKVLNDQESLELFCQSAFKKSCPESNYEELSNRAVRCCKGLPLALKVLGSHMIGKDLDGWKDALHRYEKSPHPHVQRVLRISYDSLHFNEQNIFLDIACFFKGKSLEYVKGVLDACDFSSGDGIATLVNKSLLTVHDKYNNGFHSLGMHDLIQDMGREIVKEEAPNEVAERSRLWHHDDILQVLTDNNGSSKIQVIVLDPPKSEEIDCVDTVFEKMKNLRILMVNNTYIFRGPFFLPNNLKVFDWMKYPSESFPSGSYPRKIGSIKLGGSPLLVLKPFQRCEHLTSINISRCEMVTEFPDVSGAMNLRELILDRCIRLVSIHESVGHLANLVHFSAYDCYNLKSFVPIIYLPSLEYLDFSLCRGLTHFPEIKGMMSKPLTIKMVSCTAIKELPESIKKLIGLNYLEMTNCWRLKHLPGSLLGLTTKLTTLDVRNCEKLQEIPKLPSSVQKVDAKGCISLTSKTSNMLWSQMQGEIKGLQVRMPIKTEIPEWLDYVNIEGGLPVFKARGKFPAVAVAFVFREVNFFQGIPKIHLSIDGSRGQPRALSPSSCIRRIYSQYRQYRHRLHPVSNHVLLCDLRVLLSSEELEDVAVGFGNNDWKTIQVYCEKELPISSWGLYVYKRETNMEDIQFMSHDPSSSLVSSLDAISEDENVRNTKTESQQRYDEGLVEEDSSSEDVENVDGLNHNIPQPDTHDKKSWDFFCYGGENNQEAGHSSQQRYDEGLVEEDSNLKDGGEKNQEAGPSSQQRNDKGLVEEDSSSEDVENVNGITTLTIRNRAAFAFSNFS